MKLVYVCEIVDNLSRSILHTFMAASEEHAKRQFQSFLDSFKGKVHAEDFFLIVVNYVEAPDCFDEAESFMICHQSMTFCGSDFVSSEDVKDES